jgi:hypothetical protein
MKVNDKVRFSEGFLKATFQVAGPDHPTSVGPHARGTVIDMHQLGPSLLIEVRWADSRITKIFSKNLELIP